MFIEKYDYDFDFDRRVRSRLIAFYRKETIWGQTGSGNGEGGGVNLFSFKLSQLTKEIGDKIEMGRNLQKHGVSFMSFSCKSTFLYGNNGFLSF